MKKLQLVHPQMWACKGDKVLELLSNKEWKEFLDRRQERAGNHHRSSTQVPEHLKKRCLKNTHGEIEIEVRRNVIEATYTLPLAISSDPIYPRASGVTHGNTNC